MTDDRETDHDTEKCVAVGEIAWARAIPPNNDDSFHFISFISLLQQMSNAFAVTYD